MFYPDRYLHLEPDPCGYYPDHLDSQKKLFFVGQKINVLIISLLFVVYSHVPSIHRTHKLRYAPCIDSLNDAKPSIKTKIK